MQEKIEILSLDLFGELKKEIEIVERAQKFLGQGIGWHYYLDLAWIIHQLHDLPTGSLVLDAGAGTGIMQFILAELGYNVVSADFANRTFALAIQNRYGSIIHYLNDQNVVFDNVYTRHLHETYNVPLNASDNKSATGSNAEEERTNAWSVIRRNSLQRGSTVGKQASVLREGVEEYCGRIFIYKCDLQNMPLLPENSVDAVVSVSALEHNTHDNLQRCVDELLRVTKPRGMLAVTVSASQADDWFHEPSKGWCYSEASLKNLFRLSSDAQSNYNRKDEFFARLKQENNDLHKRLAPFYFQSGNNGMPWGVWNPQYQPVGILKIK